MQVFATPAGSRGQLVGSKFRRGFLVSSWTDEWLCVSRVGRGRSSGGEDADVRLGYDPDVRVSDSYSDSDSRPLWIDFDDRCIVIVKNQYVVVHSFPSGHFQHQLDIWPMEALDRFTFSDGVLVIANYEGVR